MLLCYLVLHQLYLTALVPNVYTRAPIPEMLCALTLPCLFRSSQKLLKLENLFIRGSEGVHQHLAAGYALPHHLTTPQNPDRRICHTKTPWKCSMFGSQSPKISPSLNKHDQPPGCVLRKPQTQNLTPNIQDRDSNLDFSQNQHPSEMLVLKCSTNPCFGALPFEKMLISSRPCFPSDLVGVAQILGHLQQIM